MSVDAFISLPEPISLDEMDAVQLMNRTDTKFMMSVDQLNTIAAEIVDEYRILEIAGNRLFKYESLYYDSEDLKFYMDHHNGKTFRHKVRFRNYVQSNLCFLEVKRKFKGKTIKNRIVVNDIPDSLSRGQAAFVFKEIEEEIVLKPTIWNGFDRLTLVNKKDKERITIDFGLTYKMNGWQYQEKNLVIVEVKQEEINRNSPFMISAKKLGVRAARMSKYCVGMIRKEPDLKYNNFKSRLLKINKIDGVFGR